MDLDFAQNNCCAKKKNLIIMGVNIMILFEFGLGGMIILEGRKI